MKKQKRTDIFTAEKRSAVMSLIRSKNTKPELKVGKMLWSLGFRYRKHSRKLFGTPDFSNKARQTVVFVDSCFWHGCKKHYKEPKSNIDFWKKKIARNIERGKQVNKHYRTEGWTVIRIWDHDLKNKTVTEKVSLKLSQNLALVANYTIK